MGLEFLCGGALSALVTRNALAVILLSAAALPLAGLAAYLTEEGGGWAIVGETLWLYGAFVLGAAGALMALVVGALLFPGRSEALKVTFFGKAAEHERTQ